MEFQVVMAELARATELLAGGDVDGALGLMAQLEDQAEGDVAQAEVWARYATLFDMLELPGEAQGAVARALMLDPKNARAHYLDGVHQMVDGNFEDAVSALHRAANLYPQSDRYHMAEVYGNLGYCHRQLGDDERSEAYWELAEELDPGDPPTKVVEEAAPELPTQPPACGALDRVEALLKKAGVLKESESLYEGGSAGGAQADEDVPEMWADDAPSDLPDEFWAIRDEDDDKPRSTRPQVKSGGAPRAAKQRRPPRSKNPGRAAPPPEPRPREDPPLQKGVPNHPGEIKRSVNLDILREDAPAALDPG